MPNFDAFAMYYDADMGHFTDDLGLYHELARRADGPILDAMCGTGRVIVPLAEAGFKVFGLDIAPAMVRTVERKITELNLRDRLQVNGGDVRSFELEEHFDLALVPLNSFMHLETVADQLAALDRLKQHLRPGGLLVIDLFNPDPTDLTSDQNVLVHERTFTGPNGHQVQKYITRHTDWAAQRQAVEFVYDELEPDGTVKRRVLPFTMRWLYRFEVEHLLARAELSLEGVYGDYDLAPYASDSPQMIVFAENR